MKRLVSLGLGLMTASVAATGLAAEGRVPAGIPHLDHVFVIMMENHSYGQVIGNPAMPFINSQIKSGEVNLATNYFAVGHPSLTNYLEIVGGSNFGVRSDNSPDWHNRTCQTNLQTGIINADNDSGAAPYPIESNNICPISGTGTDAITEAVDTWNETAPPVFNYLANIDGIQSVPAAKNTSGKTIADQLTRVGLTWKSYQESLPIAGADGIDDSNGTATDLTTYNAARRCHLRICRPSPRLPWSTPTRSSTTRSLISRVCRKARIRRTACATRCPSTARAACMRTSPAGTFPRCPS